MNADVTRLELRVDRLESAVDGNGKPGLKTEMEVLKERIAVLPDLQKRLVRVERAIWTGLGLGLLDIGIRFLGK